MGTKKRLTNKEKKDRAEIKKRLQEEGLIPPDKPKLNRKKFVEEAVDRWNERENKERLIWDLYMSEAVSIMLGHTEKKSFRVSLEAVGVAKVLKLALRLEDFHEMVKARGDTSYKISEKYEYVRDILDA